MDQKELLLEIKDLHTSFRIRDDYFDAVDGVDMKLFSDEILAIVGESGCGKSTLATTIMGLHNPNFTRSTGEILFEGKNLVGLSEKEFNEKYYSLTEGDYLFSSLEEDIHIRFEGFNENNNPLFSFTGKKEIEVRDKIGPVISQKGTWIEDNVIYVEKEKIKKALKDLKKEIKISGYIEYKQKKEELKINKTEKNFSIQNETFPNLLVETKKQNILLPKIEKITFSDKEKKRNIPFVEFSPDEIEQNLDLSWFFLEENLIELTKADLERFNKENNLIENIVFLSQKKKI